jgi:RNA polymerase sigma-70 factor, ECF subfamily
VTCHDCRRSALWSVVEQDLEIALVTRLRAGDQAAFDEIYCRLNPRILSFLCRMAGNRTVAEDLAEETWLRLAAARSRLLAETRLIPWLLTVARNLYVSYCRSRAREHAYTSDLVLLWPGNLPQSPFDSASFSEFEDRLEAALAELPPLYREVLVLVGVEGLRPLEAAAVCGISAETLRQRLSRARAMLWERLDYSCVSKEVSS